MRTTKTNAYARDVQAFLFGGVLPDWATAGELVLSLHTEDPGKDGAQDTHEATYPGYKRLPVARPGGFNLQDAGSVALAANTMFAMRNQGGPAQRLPFLGIGTALSGPGKLLHTIALQQAVSVEIDGAPFIAAGDLKVQEQ